MNLYVSQSTFNLNSFLLEEFYLTEYWAALDILFLLRAILYKKNINAEHSSFIYEVRRLEITLLFLYLWGRMSWVARKILLLAYAISNWSSI